ncbi:MAG: formylmethanofuran dehydrogenase subunit E family protein [bacterium]
MSKSTLKQAERFHGHLGPWLILGLRAGRNARRRLRASPFELVALVESPAKPPVSCFIDGVQLGAGCTMGKGNIKHRVKLMVCRVIFSHRQTGEQLMLRVRDDIFQMLLNVRGHKVISLARKVYRMPLSQLFTRG